MKRLKNYIKDFDRYLNESIVEDTFTIYMGILTVIGLAAVVMLTGMMMSFLSTL